MNRAIKLGQNFSIFTVDRRDTMVKRMGPNSFNIDFNEILENRAIYNGRDCVIEENSNNSYIKLRLITSDPKDYVEEIQK